MQAQAVERQQNDIAFTKSFQRFIARQRGKITREQTLEGWRLALGAYDCALVDLTADEAGATMILLDFFEDNTKAAIPDGR
jgi:hypothetical protein